MAPPVGVARAIRFTCECKREWLHGTARHDTAYHTYARARARTHTHTHTHARTHARTHTPSGAGGIQPHQVLMVDLLDEVHTLHVHAGAAHPTLDHGHVRIHVLHRQPPSMRGRNEAH
jgi:hypothetical protein